MALGNATTFSAYDAPAHDQANGEPIDVQENQEEKEGEPRIPTPPSSNEPQDCVKADDQDQDEVVLEMPPEQPTEEPTPTALPRQSTLKMSHKRKKARTK